MHSIINNITFYLFLILMFFLTLFFERDVGFFGPTLRMIRHIIFFATIAHLIHSFWDNRNKKPVQKIPLYLVGGLTILAYILLINFHNEIIYAREILHFNNNPEEFIEYQGSDTVAIRSRNFVSYVYATGYKKIPSYIPYGHYSIFCHYRLSDNWYICSMGT